MPDIQKLPASVVNKIAAGEVIERPASVVKELVENSVDAEATRIDVSVGKGGTELIQVVDNGCGIEARQLPLAVASHATSKLQTAEDLFRVDTLGFRGEALASIAEISQFRIRSRTTAESAGAELEIHGGQAGNVEPCGCPVGTSIAVRNLFFNTPVRRKFMRTVQTEMGHISDALTRIALPHQRLHFTLSHNDREIYDLPPVEHWRDRIGVLFGRELTAGLIPVSAQEGDVRMHGYVAEPSHSRANNRMQYLFLNGRHIRDRALGHALKRSLPGAADDRPLSHRLLMFGNASRTGGCQCTPHQARGAFPRGGQALQPAARNATFEILVDGPHGAAQLAGAEGPADPSTTPSQTRGRIQQWAHAQSFQKFPALSGQATLAPPVDSAMPRQSSLGLEFPRTSSGPLPPRGVAGHEDVPADVRRLPSSGSNTPDVPAQGSKAIGADGSTALQVYNRYLITETEEGVVVIDQHALHERILYEEIREKVLGGAAEMQRLLVPEPVQLTAEEAAAVLEHRDTLRQLGMDVESFGSDTILVSAYPAMLANLNPGDILQQIAEKLRTPEKSLERRDLLDELLHMISCKAAIKAGDRLTAEEINALLERRYVVQDAHHCPHGRPTTLVFSREELDRRFKRI